jgi:LPXTG-motif cell wall-anchored protein/uncharacterized repeat protein (TIGR01451 family)
MQLVSKSSWLSKFIAIAISIAMVLSFSSVGTALAANDDNQGDTSNTATITINNAVKGTKYLVYKLFDATVSDDNKSIAYQTTEDFGIPADLKDFFSATADENGDIPTGSIVSVAIKAFKDTDSATSTDYSQYPLPEASEELVTALKTWVESLTEDDAVKTVTPQSTGSEEITDLSYGYYVVVSVDSNDDVKSVSHIAVTSIKPYGAVEIKDVATEPGSNVKKTVNNKNVSVGDKVTFTVSFTASNYYESDDNGLEEITKYTITDTLPSSLSSDTVKNVVVSYTPYSDDDEYEGYVTGVEFNISHDDNNNDVLNISIPWDKSKPSPTTVSVSYDINVNSTVLKNSDEQNTNSATVSWNTDSAEGTGGTASETIKTSAIAIQKVNENGKPLKGATFSVKGLTVEDTTESGVYTVASYDSNSGTYSKALSCNENGVLVILGIEPSGDTTSADGTTITSTNTLTVQEEQAPNGYNKMVGTEDIEVWALRSDAPSAASEDSESSKITAFKDLTTYAAALNIETTSEMKDGETVYKSEEHNYNIHVLTVKNSKGTILPSTGGMGTTILYVIGGLLIVCAGGALYIRRRNQA